MTSQNQHQNSLFSSDSAPLVVFGEVLYDCFPERQRVLGGAPFNVAWGLKGLGQDPLFVSAVGDDDDGESIRSRMKAWGLSTSGLQTDDVHPTGVVNVTIEDDEPIYEICENRAWDYVADTGISCNVMLYHGLLSLRNDVTRDTLKAIVNRSSAKRFFDVNLRPPYDSMETVKEWLSNVSWLKLNLDELATLYGGPVDFDDCMDAVTTLRNAYHIENVLVTAGSQGAKIIGIAGEASFTPAPNPDPFVDTVGAGDSFAAYTIHGLMTGMAIDSIVEEASEFAAKVCGLQGATTSDTQFYQ